ncbi:hypothetical protein Tsubulata_031759 [Turnera subulata]|uniref:Cyclin-dependent protein kinase inhibitor SMR4 n=1 Tax=Turnera subulata TaxID=218843 RepID=A0A9Q0F103_9ROSI|nr:hypothetical protein Tsubulata_031759 [Turnera subulata]
MEEGCMTPRHVGSRIPAAGLVCPPPPRKKPAVYYEEERKRDPPKGGYFQPPDLEAFFTIIAPIRRQACS